MDHDQFIIEVVDERKGVKVSLSSNRIKVTHVPTGLVAIAECRSQHHSRHIALSMVQYGLVEMGYKK